MPAAVSRFWGFCRLSFNFGEAYSEKLSSTFCYHAPHIMLNLFVDTFHRCLSDLQCLSKIWFFFSFFFLSWSNFKPQCTKCACMHQVLSSSTWPFFIIFPLNSVYRFLSNLHPSTICFWSFLLLCPFFVCQTWRTASLPFDATSSHAFACYCVEQRKDLIHHKLFIVFTEICYWTVPACWTCMVFFFFSSFSFCAWRCPFCRMTPAWHSYFIYGLLTFLRQQQKSDRTSHLPHTLSTVRAFQLCWSAPPSAVIRLQWVRNAFLLEVDQRRDRKKKDFTEINKNPFLEANLLLKAYIVI